MDVAAWLRDLGLERYVSAFRDNDIEAAVLPKLTAEDLISIGVISVGHRRKLLDAILFSLAQPFEPAIAFGHAGLIGLGGGFGRSFHNPGTGLARQMTPPFIPGRSLA